ncbi:hypothetical protein PR048_020626 [Dryococelus australis]|uniref:Uncharacterized protein n=1 Tax=Dryococelus australis TaxID=614101 RepID=A0ABQ9H6V3_9NEOP|nr:hypothetical protein PR048_020626 [Dryococelus australis]
MRCDVHAWVALSAFIQCNMFGIAPDLGCCIRYERKSLRDERIDLGEIQVRVPTVEANVYIVCALQQARHDGEQKKNLLLSGCRGCSFVGLTSQCSLASHGCSTETRYIAFVSNRHNGGIFSPLVKHGREEVSHLLVAASRRVTSARRGTSAGVDIKHPRRGLVFNTCQPGRGGGVLFHFHPGQFELRMAGVTDIPGSSSSELQSSPSGHSSAVFSLRFHADPLSSVVLSCSGSVIHGTHLVSHLDKIRCRRLREDLLPRISGTAVVWWLANSPPTEFDSRRGRSRNFACGNRAGRCLWSAGFFFGELPFPTLLHSNAAPYSHSFTLIDSQDLDVKSRSNIFTHSSFSSTQMNGKLTSTAHWLSAVTVEGDNWTPSSTRCQTKFRPMAKRAHVIQINATGSPAMTWLVYLGLFSVFVAEKCGSDKATLLRSRCATSPLSAML